MEIRLGEVMDYGVKIKSITDDSFFYRAGLRRNDVVTHIDGQRITDELDFRFYAAADLFNMALVRGTKNLELIVQRVEGSFLDVEFFEKPINLCKNRCIFCFIDQMPPGLRSSLYIKDEDFKHSFFNGNYVTLSSATKTDLQRVAMLGISPLFISVHATDTSVRNKMLRNSKAPPILEQLLFLKESGVSFHTQIVVCKGYNDGDVLLKTIKDLFSFGQSLMSIAVVPVGLTIFRKFPLNGIDSDTAQWVCNEINKISEVQKDKDGFRKLFLADEFFIKAGMKIPGRDYYEEYPQLENGIGLVRQMLDKWAACKRKIKSGKIKLKSMHPSLVVTSVSAFAFIDRIIKDAKAICPDLDINVVAVVNRFFGETVTVAGLLTAKDIIRTIKYEIKTNHPQKIYLPSVMFNYQGYTIDGYSFDRIKKILDMDIRVVESVEDFFKE